MSGAETIRVGGDTLRFHVSGEESNGALLAADVSIPAGGGPPLLHSHEPAELYRVVRGELALYIEREDGVVERHVAGPGEVVHIPARAAHTVRNECDEAAHAFVVFTPAGELEGFIRGVGALAEAGEVTPGQIVAVAERHGIEFGPPVVSPSV